MSENVSARFNVELVLLHDFLIVLDALLQHVIVGSQMRVHHTERAAVQRKTDTYGAFISLHRELTALFIERIFESSAHLMRLPKYQPVRCAYIRFPPDARAANAPAWRTTAAANPAFVPF